MWVSILFAFVLAAGLVSWIVWRSEAFDLQRIGGLRLALAAGLFWGVLSLLLHGMYWDSYYRYFAPDYVKWLAPLAVLFYAGICLGLYWLARRLPMDFGLGFCLLGGLESIPEHLLGIFRFRILEIPMLQGVDPLLIFLFAFFEYVVYWSAVLLLAVLLNRIWPQKKSTGRMESPAR